MNTVPSATVDAFARAPLPERFCNLDRLLHAMKARGLDGIVATACGTCSISHRSMPSRTSRTSRAKAESNKITGACSGPLGFTMQWP